MNMNPERSSRSVFIGNIPYETTEEQLKEIFSQAGTITNLRLVYDRETGKPKGYGFCEYVDLETAQSAMRNLNNYEFKGRQLRVGIAAGDLGREERGIPGPITEQNPYGDPVEPDQAPEAISRAVASLPPEQMFELMKQMKLCIQNNPAEARNMLLQNPQLAYALLQAQIVMKIVDPKVAMAMLHRQSDQIPPPAPVSTAPLLATPPSRPLNTSASSQLPFLDHTESAPAVFSASSHVSSQPMAQSAPLLATPSLSTLSGTSGPMPQQGMGGSRPPGPGSMAPMSNMPPSQIPGPRHEMAPRPEMGQPRMAFPGNEGGPPRQFAPGQQDMMRQRGAVPPQDMMPRPMGSVGQGDMMGNMRIRGPEMVRSRGPIPPDSIDPRVRSSMQSEIVDPRARPMGPQDVMAGRPRAPGPQDSMGQRPRGPMPMGGDTRPMGQLDPRGQRMPGSAVNPRQQVPGGYNNQEPTTASQGPPNSQLNQQEQEKAALIMQVLQLSDEQIQMLPPDQRQSILILKEQIARSSMQQMR